MRQRREPRSESVRRSAVVVEQITHLGREGVDTSVVLGSERVSHVTVDLVIIAAGEAATAEARGANAPRQEHGGSTGRCGGLVTKVEQRQVNGDVRVRLDMRRVLGGVHAGSSGYG
jgi:hypothetical protein